MFENLQDTCLLQNGLLSAATFIKSQKKSENEDFDLKDEFGAAKSVFSTINILNQLTVKDAEPNEVLKKQLLLNRRCHAAIFFTVLRSNGITSPQAAKYFETIIHTFHTMDWKFYVKLNYHSKWSEYFIECCHQLEPDILSSILQKILTINWSDEEILKYYSWHMVLQIVIQRFFMIDDPSLRYTPDCYTFNFPFVDSNSEQGSSTSLILEENCVSENKLLHVFTTLLNLMKSSVQLDNLNYIKIILHAYKTIFKLLLSLNVSKINAAKELFQLTPLLRECFYEEQSLVTIETALHKIARIHLNHFHALTSWEININYLMFLLICYSGSFMSKSKDSELKDTVLYVHLSEVVMQFNLYHNSWFEGNKTNTFDFLKTVIIYQYPCATKAAAVLLKYPAVREDQDILDILDEKVLTFEFKNVCNLLADAVVEATSEKIKKRFLNMLFQQLYQSTHLEYIEFLEYILKKYGFNEYFILDTFESQLATFTRKTMTVDEAKKLFHPLIIQSPKKVLKTLIEQALLRGPKEINLSQIFLYMPTVCLFEDFLVSELLCYLSKDELLDNERKNLMQVIQIIMEVSCCTMIINFDAFLEKCIIPNLSNSDNKLYFTIECLNISLKVFTEQKEIYISSSIYVSFIKSLCSKMDVSIKSGNGMLKELIVTAFYYLEKMQNPCSSIEEKSNLKSDLSHFPVTTRIYVAKLLEINSYEDLTRSESEELSEELWIWCCHHKDKALFHKCILNKVLSEMDLIQILMKTLPHCSKDEWLESANLIKELLMDSNHATILSNTPWLLPKCDHQVYGIIRCFMDCYYFLHEDQQTGNLQYITNCFSNTIMNLLSTQVDEHIFLNVFLAVCHLCSVCESGVTLLSSFLLRIQQLLQLICKDKDLRGYYLKLLYHGVKYIPDFDEKNSILEKFQ